MYFLIFLGLKVIKFRGSESYKCFWKTLKYETEILIHEDTNVPFLLKLIQRCISSFEFTLIYV